MLVLLVGACSVIPKYSRRGLLATVRFHTQRRNWAVVLAV
jgi:hypothetical protein